MFVMKDKLLEQIRESVTCRVDGQDYILLEQTRRLAREYDMPLREVEIAALEARVLPSRYQRNIGTAGWEGQIKLLCSCVAVIGAGGLGGGIIEALARLGVGKLVIVDGDEFNETNLNRQLLNTEANLGRSKVEAAKNRVAAINSAVEVSGYETLATVENLPEILRGVDVLVDAVDRIPTRLVLQRAAQAAGIPMVHGAIAGFVGQVMTIFPGDAGLFAIYGENPPEHGMETEQGTPAGTPMLIGAWQVQEVYKLLTGKGEPLRGRLVFIDALAGTADVLEIG